MINIDRAFHSILSFISFSVEPPKAEIPNTNLLKNPSKVILLQVSIKVNVKVLAH
jgi:hypothetical protein